MKLIRKHLQNIGKLIKHQIYFFPYIYNYTCHKNLPNKVILVYNDISGKITFDSNAICCEIHVNTNALTVNPDKADFFFLSLISRVSYFQKVSCFEY